MNVFLSNSLGRSLFSLHFFPGPKPISSGPASPPGHLSSPFSPLPLCSAPARASTQPTPGHVATSASSPTLRQPSLRHPPQTLTLSGGSHLSAVAVATIACSTRMPHCQLSTHGKATLNSAVSVHTRSASSSSLHFPKHHRLGHYSSVRTRVAAIIFPKSNRHPVIPISISSELLANWIMSQRVPDIPQAIPTLNRPLRNRSKPSPQPLLLHRRSSSPLHLGPPSAFSDDQRNPLIGVELMLRHHWHGAAPTAPPPLGGSSPL